MPAARVCNGCGRRFKPTGSENRCEDCGPVPDRRERAGEPWRALYAMAEWQRARWRALVRDGHRCRGEWHGRRCRATSGLQVHHRRPLRELWREALDTADFVALACNLEWLVTLCPRCHAAAERMHDHNAG